MSEKRLYDKTSVQELTAEELSELKADYTKFKANEKPVNLIIIIAAAVVGVCMLVLAIISLIAILNGRGAEKFSEASNAPSNYVAFGAGLWFFVVCLAACLICGVKEKKRSVILSAFRIKYSNALISSYEWENVLTPEQKASGARMALKLWGGSPSASSSGSSYGSSSSATPQPTTNTTYLYGSGYGDSYYVNGYNEILKSGTGSRTGFKMIGNSICLVSDSRTIGWLHPGGVVNYANDYYGARPFSSWEKK
ncbi:MAG: hypothetical protein HDP34_03130 [Clostridia bacterium]|nr:hypothetical protein [Clostridia bacterium]